MCNAEARLRNVLSGVLKKGSVTGETYKLNDRARYHPRSPWVGDGYLPSRRKKEDGCPVAGERCTGLIPVFQGVEIRIRRLMGDSFSREKERRQGVVEWI
jgi:hypothetical protein